MKSTRELVTMATQDPEAFVLEFDYTDRNGTRTRRIVSPYKWKSDGKSFLAFCFGRETVRAFQLARIKNLRLVASADVVCPIPVDNLPPEDQPEEQTPEGEEKRSGETDELDELFESISARLCGGTHDREDYLVTLEELDAFFLEHTGRDWGTWRQSGRIREDASGVTMSIEERERFEQRLAKLQRDVSFERKRTEEIRKDIHAAAGELEIDVPEPGTILAKLVSANVILRRERGKLERQVNELEHKLEQTAKQPLPVVEDKRPTDAEKDLARVRGINRSYEASLKAIEGYLTENEVEIHKTENLPAWGVAVAGGVRQLCKVTKNLRVWAKNAAERNDKSADVIQRVEKLADLCSILRGEVVARFVPYGQRSCAAILKVADDVADRISDEHKIDKTVLRAELVEAIGDSVRENRELEDLRWEVTEEDDEAIDRAIEQQIEEQVNRQGGDPLCAHGNPPAACDACDRLSDHAFDAGREDRVFGRR